MAKQICCWYSSIAGLQRKACDMASEEQIHLKSAGSLSVQHMALTELTIRVKTHYAASALAGGFFPDKDIIASIATLPGHCKHRVQATSQASPLTPEISKRDVLNSQVLETARLLEENHHCFPERLVAGLLRAWKHGTSRACRVLEIPTAYQASARTGCKPATFMLKQSATPAGHSSRSPAAGSGSPSQSLPLADLAAELTSSRAHGTQHTQNLRPCTERDFRHTSLGWNP